MSLQEVLQQLAALASEKVRIHYSKNGAGDNLFGVKLSDIRKLAKTIKTNHPLAMELWDTGNIDARFLAILIIKPKELSLDEMNRLVRTLTFERVADWFSSYVAKHHPDKERLRQEWMTATHPMAARTGWSLTHERIIKRPEGLDLSSLLDRIQTEMGDADDKVKWTMNFCLGEIGIRFPEFREQAIRIGETLGIYRDYPVSKGCTSPFVPVWIREMVSRQG